MRYVLFGGVVLWLVATLLLVVGLLVMVNTAVRVYRERA